MHGVTATLGKRLQWPDNYFQINSSLSYQRYLLDNYSGIFVFSDGTAYNLNFTQEISRNSMTPYLPYFWFSPSFQRAVNAAILII